MFPVLQLGPFVVQVAELALLLGAGLSLVLIEREAGRLGLPAARVWRLAVIGLLAGVIGARLGYVASYRSIYAADPLAIFSPTATAFTPEVGIAVGMIAALIYGQRHALPLRTTLDALTPGLAVLALAVGVANLASGDGYGAPAHLPWSISLWSAERHPSQVYEILAALAVLGIWVALRKWRLPAGSTFSLLVALLAAARTFLEAFRGDSQLLAGGIRAAQVWALVVLAICLWLLQLWNREAIAPGLSTSNHAPAEGDSAAADAADTRTPTVSEM